MQIKKLILTAVIISISIITSFSAKEKSKFDLETPYSTISNHLNYLNKKRYNPELSAKTLNYKGIQQQKRERLAIKLKQILDGKGLWIYYENLPTDPNYIDSSKKTHTYVLFHEYPMIYVEKIGNKWLYSAETVEAIPKLHKEVFPYGADKLMVYLPKIGQKIVVGLQAWQWVIILILIIIAYSAHRILAWILGIFVFRIVRKVINPEVARTFIKPLARPVSLLIVLMLLSMFTPVIQLPIKINGFIIIGLKVMASFFGIMIFYRLVDVLGAYMKRAAQKTDSTLDDQLVPLITKTVKIFVVIIGSLFVLQNLKFNVTALLAGLSIGGLAFALAAQDALKNLFGSLMIFLDKPFQIGDWIVTKEFDGTVEEVGFRTTRVRTFQNSLISIPNGKLADLTIDNMGMRSYRRFKTHVGLTYDTPPDLIEAYIEGIKEIVKTHPHTRKDYYIVQLHEMADYSLNILIYVFFKAETWSLELKYRHELLIAIIKLAEELGARFALPTETMFIEEMPGHASLTPKHTASKDEYSSKIARVLRNLKNTKSFRSPHTERTRRPSNETDKGSEIKSDQHLEKKTLKTLFKDQFGKKKQPIIIPKEEKSEIIQKTTKKGKELTETEIVDIAKNVNLELASLKTIIEVESKNKGFFPNGKPTISFHGHKFWQELKKRNVNPEDFEQKNPDIVFPRWIKKHYKNSEKEYDRLDKAKTINKEAAYAATSWGMFQMLGSNYSDCGFNSIEEFVYNQFMTEKEQLESLTTFLKSKNFIKDIQQQDWKIFAKKYNGPTYARHNIDTKLENAYKKYA